MSYINATFAKRLSENDIIGLVKELQQCKLISFDENNKVQYCL